GPIERFREWRTAEEEREPPTTEAGAIRRGLARLAVFVAAASGIAYGLSAAIGRGPALGFYIVGALLLARTLFVSGGGVGGRPDPRHRSERGRRKLATGSDLEPRRPGDVERAASFPRALARDLGLDDEVGTNERARRVEKMLQQCGRAIEGKIGDDAERLAR